MKEYTFDITLLAAITVKAATQEEAEKTIRHHMDGMDCNGGMWPNGDPILFEASLEGDLDLVSVDGEFESGM